MNKGNLAKVLLGSLLACIAALLLSMKPIASVSAASVVSSRMEEIRKEYPEGSLFNKEVLTSVMEHDGNESQYEITICLGGCNGLVGYVTMKVFHNPFTPDTTASYKKIGESSSVDVSGMRNLFSKAKPGDVVAWNKSSNHYAIFLSSDAYGIFVYEANFGGKNKVKYNNNWKWENMKSWSHGAKRVTVWRSRNYNKVNKKKAAKNLKKGSKFTINNITYKVTNSSITHGRVKVVSKNKKVPKAVGLRYDMNRIFSRYVDSVGTKRTKHDAEREYYTLPDTILDEQYFVVEERK